MVDPVFENSTAPLATAESHSTICVPSRSKSPWYFFSRTYLSDSKGIHDRCKRGERGERGERIGREEDRREERKRM